MSQNESDARAREGRKALVGPFLSLQVFLLASQAAWEWKATLIRVYRTLWIPYVITFLKNKLYKYLRRENFPDFWREEGVGWSWIFYGSRCDVYSIGCSWPSLNSATLACNAAKTTSSYWTLKTTNLSHFPKPEYDHILKKIYILLNTKFSVIRTHSIYSNIKKPIYCKVKRIQISYTHWRIFKSLYFC